LFITNMRIKHKPACMAGFLLLAMIWLSLGSCSELAPYLAFQQEWNYSFNDGGMAFVSMTDLLGWVSTTITYSSDMAVWGHEEYWASPQQTFDADKGDCDDKAILFMYFAYTRGLSRDLYFLGVTLPNGAGHALVEDGARCYDPTNGTSYPVSAMSDRVLYRLNYGQTLFIASHDHAQAREAVPGPILSGVLTGRAIIERKVTQGDPWLWESQRDPTRRCHDSVQCNLPPLPGTMVDYR
jgi:Bacterial transglutaminase-like cysteine proteinase BTLCP